MEKSDYYDGSKAFEGDPLILKTGTDPDFNSTATNKRVMSKVKPNRICVSLQQRVRSSIRYVAIVVLVFVLAYFGVHYMQIDHQTLPMLAKDRSESYNVKILPENLSDKELNELPKESFSYLAMIDAGSSGCRAHVYRYGKLGTLSGPLYILPQHQSKKVKPGLSTFADKPQEAGVSLADLVSFLKEQVPEKDWDVTPIWLKATAGLRMLPSEKSEAILDSVRAFLSDKKASPFLFRASWAKVIPGNEEGGFGWIAFNYLKKIIGPKRDRQAPLHPYAVIEMGGASAQVSQMAPTPAEAAKIPTDYRFSFTIEDDEYHLYTHSYLGYGAEQAREQFNRHLAKQAAQAAPADPCKNDGSAASARHYHYRQLTDPPVAASAAAAASTTSSGNAAAAASTATTATATTSASSSAPASSVVAGAAGSAATMLGQCAASLTALFAPSTATATAGSDSPACSLALPQSFNCVHQPTFVAQSPNILAFENFFYMSSALAVPPVASAAASRGGHHHHAVAPPAAHAHGNGSSSSGSAVVVQPTTFPLETTASLIRKTSDHYCALPWSAVDTAYPKDAQPKDVNGKMCFLSAFAYAFLVDGLKIPAEKTITIQKEVDGSEIEWALGAAYKEAAGFLKRTNLRPT